MWTRDQVLGFIGAGILLLILEAWLATRLPRQLDADMDKWSQEQAEQFRLPGKTYPHITK